MNSYWDLTEQERAAMTREQVSAFLDVELMQKGVAKVHAPTLHDIPELELPTTEYFGVEFKGDYSMPRDSGFVFTTLEQAQAFINAQPLKKDVDYPADGRNFAKPCCEGKITPTQLPSEQAVLNTKAQLEEVRTLKEANQKANDTYSEARKAINEATSGVWENWDRCREKMAEAEAVRDTWQEYVKLCDGNTEIARTFLDKLYDPHRIEEAVAWLGPDSLATEEPIEATV